MAIWDDYGGSLSGPFAPAKRVRILTRLTFPGRAFIPDPETSLKCSTRIEAFHHFHGLQRNPNAPSLDRLATLYLCHPAARLLGHDTAARVPILMYHSISDNLFAKSHRYYQINTSPEVFAQQMRWLRRNRYRTMDLTEMLEAMQAGLDLSRTVVITYDDGYQDFYTDALPVMKQCGFTATIFLATDRIQDSSVRVEGADYLTWREVRELHAEGIRFGSHTVTHSRPALARTGANRLRAGLFKRNHRTKTGRFR